MLLERIKSDEAAHAAALERERAAAQAKYRQILARADTPHDRDADDLAEALGVLSRTSGKVLTSADVERDLRAIREARLLEARLLADADKQALHAGADKVQADVLEEQRDRIVSLLPKLDARQLFWAVEQVETLLGLSVQPERNRGWNARIWTARENRDNRIKQDQQDRVRLSELRHEFARVLGGGGDE